MATTYNRIQLYRFTAAQFTSNNPTLLQGETGIETDTNKTKVGDGTTAWNSLYYNNVVNILTASDDYVIPDGAYDFHITFTRQAADKTITLPDATLNAGRKISIKVTGSGAGNVSLAGDDVDGAVSTGLVWYGEGTIELVSNGTDYYSLGQGIKDVGTFTPSIQFSGASVGMTYGVQTGNFTRTGNKFDYSINTRLTAKGSSTGNATVAGFPIAAASVPYGVTSLYFVTISFADFPEAYIAPSSSAITLFEITNAGTRTNLDNSNFVDTSILIMSGSYFV